MRPSRRTLLATLACLPALPLAAPVQADELESDVLNPATPANFDELVIEAEEPVFLYIWAPWCGSCKRTNPQVQKAAKALRDSVTFATLNHDKASTLARRMGVKAVPTMILFYQGRERGRRSGTISSEKLESWILARL